MDTLDSAGRFDLTERPAGAPVRSRRRLSWLDPARRRGSSLVQWAALSAGQMPALKWLAILIPVGFLTVGLLLVTGPFLGAVRSPIGFAATVTFMVIAVASFASVVFAAIDRLQRAVMQRSREMEALLYAGKQLTTTLDMEEVLRRAVAAVVDTSNVESAELWVVQPERQRVTMRKRHGSHADAFMEQTSFALGEGYPGIVAATGKPLIVHNLGEDPLFLREKVKKAGYRTFVGLPLRSTEGIVGVLAIASRAGSAFTSKEELRLLEGMADHIAVALENAKLHEQVQALAAVMERERIGRELHDGMAQILTYINSKTQSVSLLLEKGRPDEARSQLVQMAEAARGLYAEVRQSILALRTGLPKGGDLRSILREYLDEFAALSELSIRLQEDDPSAERLSLLSPTQEIQVLRIIQEALSNVRQHAKASSVEITLQGGPEELVIAIRDDGQGFDPQSRGPGRWPKFGLQSMEERAKATGGSLSVESTPGSGTKVTLCVPIAPVGQEAP